MRRWLLALAAVAILLGVAVVGGLVALLTGQVPGVTRVALEATLGRLLGAQVRIERFEGSLVREFALRGARVESPGGGAVEIDRLHAALDTQALAQGRLRIEALEVDGLVLHVRRDAADGEWFLNGWSLETAEPEDTGELQDAVEAPAPEPLLEVGTLTLANVDLDAEWSREAEAGQARGRLGGVVGELAWPPTPGRPWPASSRLRLEIREAAALRVAFQRGSLELVQEDRSLGWTLSGAQGVAGRVDGRGQGQLAGSLLEPALDRLEADLQIAGVDLAALTGREDLRSDLVGGGELTWLRAEDRWSGRAHLGPSTFAGRAIASAALAGSVRATPTGADFELDALELDSQLGRLQASAAGDGDRVRSLRVRIEGLDLAAIPAPWRPSPRLSGRVAASADLAGPWRDLRGALELDAADVDARPALGGPERSELRVRTRARLLGGGRLRVDALEVADGARPGLALEALEPFELGWREHADGAGTALDVDGMRLAIAAGELRADGGLARIGGRDPARLRDLHVRAQGLQLAGLRALAGALGVALDPELDSQLGGTLAGHAVLTGLLAAPVLEGEVVWLEPRWGELAADRIRLSLAPADERPRAGVVAGAVERRGVEVLRLAGRVPERRVGGDAGRIWLGPAAHYELELAGLEAGWLDPLVGSERGRLAGTLSGRAVVDGPLDAPRLTGSLTWTDPVWRELAAERLEIEARLGDPDGSAANGLDARVRLVREGRASLEAELTLEDGTRLLRPEVLAQDPGARLALRFDDFDAGWLAPFLGSGVAGGAGRLDGVVEVRGGKPAPGAEGTLTLAGVRIGGAPLTTPLGPAEGVLVFSGRSVALRDLELASGDGRAVLAGVLAWDDPGDPALRLDLRLERFAIEQPGVIEGVLDGAVSLEGVVSALRSEGSLELSRADISLPDTQDPLVREIRVSGLPDAGEPESIFEGREGGVLDRLAADVSLTLGDEVWLRGLGAELALEGDLRARKPSGRDPGLFGNVNVRSGRVDFRGKWLRVEEGSAVFDGSPDPDPYLDATAVHRVRDVVLWIRFYGRASDLQMEIDSEPPMSREDRLSYLLFDRPVGELDSDTQGRLGTAAGVLALDMALGEFASPIVEGVGLDRVRVGVDEDDLPIFELEKQVHPRVAVRYGRRFAGGGDRFVVEWRLFRRFFLTGEQYTSGESAIDFLWRLDF